MARTNTHELDACMNFMIDGMTRVAVVAVDHEGHSPEWSTTTTATSVYPSRPEAASSN